MSTRTVRCAILAALASLGLVQTASAYYDPRTGRFISRDPIGEPGAAMLARGAVGANHPGTSFIQRDGSEPGGSNRYAYVFNAPINDVDPLGELSLLDDTGDGPSGSNSSGAKCPCDKDPANQKCAQAEGLTATEWCQYKDIYCNWDKDFWPWDYLWAV
jgi:uncharacterized protein RhaS with RHS repeats